MGNNAEQALEDYFNFMGKPSLALRPNLKKHFDNNTWEAVYGDLVGVGDTPYEAFIDFDMKFWGSEEE